MQLNDFDTSQRYVANVLHSQRLTPNDADEVRELILALPSHAPDCAVGHCVGLIVPGNPATDNPVSGQREHFRLYTVAGLERDATHERRLRLLVKRCHYLDPYSGEHYPGVASNYWCDRKPGDVVTLCGPYGLPFTLPTDTQANILMIGMGTGIAPFRALVQQMYATYNGWQGQVRLFYGAQSGLELAYMNDERNDFAQYYDRATFKAFQVVSARPGWTNTPNFTASFEQQREAIWPLLNSDIYVYVAGLASIYRALNDALGKLAGSVDKWDTLKQRLVATKRWTELIY